MWTELRTEGPRADVSSWSSGPRSDDADPALGLTFAGSSCLQGFTPRPGCQGHGSHRAGASWPSHLPEPLIFPHVDSGILCLPTPTQRAAQLFVFPCGCLEDRTAKFRQASKTFFKIPDDMASRTIKFISVSLQPSSFVDRDTSRADGGAQVPPRPRTCVSAPRERQTRSSSRQ